MSAEKTQLLVGVDCFGYPLPSAERLRQVTLMVKALGQPYNLLSRELQSAGTGPMPSNAKAETLKPEDWKLRAEKAESELERARRELARIAGGLKSVAGACVDEKPYPEIREMVMDYAHKLTELANSEGPGGE